MIRERSWESVRSRWWLPETVSVKPVSSVQNHRYTEQNESLLLLLAASGALRGAYSRKRKRQPTGLLCITVVLSDDGSVVSVGRPAYWKEGVAQLVKNATYHVFELCFRFETNKGIKSSVLSSDFLDRVDTRENKQDDIETSGAEVEYKVSTSYGSAAEQGSRRVMEDTHIAEPCIRYWIKKNLKNIFSQGNSQEPGSITENNELMFSLMELTKHIQVFAVFDGHRGKHASTIAKKVFLREFCSSICEQKISSGKVCIELGVREALKLTEDIVLETAKQEGWDSGTTAVVCVVNKNQIISANIGDSRAVLSLDGKAKLMTEDHNLCNKKEAFRCESEGCSIKGGYLSNELCVTRALGDIDLKTQEKLTGLSSEPYFEVYDVSCASAFLVLACDGLWDVLGIQSVVNFVRMSLDRHGDPELAAEEIVQQAMNRSSTDNITAIVILLRRDVKKPRVKKETPNGNIRRRPVINFSALSGEVQQILFQAANGE